MGSWHDLVGRLLPWYDARRERMRDARTEQVVRRSVVARLRARRVIEEYRNAAADVSRSVQAADKAGEAVIEEITRADDER
jgi:hypothetical protein